VTLLVSDGPPRVEVPDLVGLDRAGAESRLQAEQLELGRVSEQYSDGVEAGKIIRHTPGQGEFADFGDKVDVVVSAGPEPVVVPDVTGKTLDEAREILEEAGFEVRAVNLVPGSSTVYSQSDAGKEKPKGSTIWIWA
jgi:eukaryotic-like serine/threonine-protein kinase